MAGPDGRVVFSTELDESGVKKGLSKLGSSIGTFAKGAGVALGAIGAGLGVLARQGLAYNSQMEQYMASFETMLGSTEAAQRKVAELKKFAAETPFEMADLARATQTILGFGIAEDKASVAMKQLGDISQGNKDKFNSLALVYGQMSSTGKLMGQDLLQMINTGFNPLTVIADKTGASMGDLKKTMSGEKTSAEFKAMLKTAQAEVKKLGDGASDSAKLLAQIGAEGAISADVVDKAMEIATSKGGLYYGAMEKQAKTAAGMIATLTDNFQSLGGEAFAGLSEAAKSEALPAAMAYVNQMAEGLRANGVKGLVSAFGDVLGGVVGQASSYAPQVVGMAMSLIKSLVGGLKKNAKVIAKGLGETFKAATGGIISLIPEMMAALGETAEDLIPEMLDAAIDLLVSLCENADDLLEAGAAIIKGVLRGVLKGVPAIVRGIGQAMMALFTHNDEIQKAVDEDCADMLNAYTKLKKEIAATDEKYKTTAESVNTNYEAALALLDTYDKLNAKENKTDQDMAELAAIAESIKTVYPEIAQYIDPITGVFTVSTQAIRDNIQALKDQAMAAAAMEMVTEKAKELIKAQEALNEASGKASVAGDQLDDLKAYGEVLDGLYGKVSNGAVNFNNLGAEFATLIENHATLKSMYDKLDDGSYQLKPGVDYAGAQEAAQTALLSLLGQNQDEIAIQQGVYDTAIGKVNEYAAEQVKLNAAIEKYLTLSTGAGSESAKQAAEAKEAAALLEKAWGKGGLTKKEKSGIFGTGKEGKANQKEFEGLLAAMPDLSASNAEWVAWQTSIDALCEKVPKLAEYLGILNPKVEDTAEALDLPEKPSDDTGPMTKSIQADIDGAATALENGKTSLKEKAIAARDAVNTGFTGGKGNETGEDEGTSEASNLGAAIIDEIATGMEKNDRMRGVVMQKTGVAIAGARSTYGSSAKGPSYAFGQNIVGGIGAGAQSKGSWLNTLLANIVKAALDAAKKAAGVNSPSLLFARELGSPLGEGIGFGFAAKMESDVIPAMVKSIAASAKAGKAALDNTLLGRVQGIMAGGVNYPSVSSLSTSALRGSTLAALGGGSSGNAPGATVNFAQHITFEATMQAPDEVARAMRRAATYGLAGAN